MVMKSTFPEDAVERIRRQFFGPDAPGKTEDGSTLSEKIDRAVRELGMELSEAGYKRVCKEIIRRGNNDIQHG